VELTPTATLTTSVNVNPAPAASQNIPPSFATAPPRFDTTPARAQTTLTAPATTPAASNLPPPISHAIPDRHHSPAPLCYPSRRELKAAAPVTHPPGPGRRPERSFDDKANAHVRRTYARPNPARLQTSLHVPRAWLYYFRNFMVARRTHTCFRRGEWDSQAVGHPSRPVTPYNPRTHRERLQNGVVAGRANFSLGWRR
jgi:hypothetical protein